MKLLLVALLLPLRMTGTTGGTGTDYEAQKPSSLDLYAEVWGPVVSVSEEAVLLIDQYGAQVQANLKADTQWIGDLPVPGDFVLIAFDGARTRGIPAQLWADSVACLQSTGTAVVQDGQPALSTEGGIHPVALDRLGNPPWPEGATLHLYYAAEAETLDVIGLEAIR